MLQSRVETRSSRWRSIAHTAEKIRVGGRRVKVANGTHGSGRAGKTQTINVYDQSDREGNYEQVYRIRGPEHFVTLQDLTRNAPSLQPLDAYLERRGAIREGPRRRS